MTAHGTIFHNSIGKRPPTGGVGQDKAGQKSADARPNDAGLVTKMLQPGEQRIAANIYCQHTKKRNCSERRVKMGFG